jgi:DNA polymerase-3 subunit alpha
MIGASRAGDAIAMTTAAQDFVHLRTHSHYSLLTATCRIPELISAARADGQRALALTDNGNLFGAIEFYRACRAADVRPILGMAAYAAGRSRHLPSGADNPTYELTLLAEDAEGWANLRLLSSLANKEGFHYRPRIDRELLACHARGLIVLSGNLAGEISQHLLGGRYAEARAVAAELAAIAGKDRFYLEMMEIGCEPQRRVNPGLLRLRDELGLPIVATNDVHYIAAADWIVQDVALCIRDGRTLNDANRYRMPSRELFFKTRQQMAEAFAELPDALANTVAIAERCAVELDFKSYHLPRFHTGSDESPDEMFERLCREGARRRFREIEPHVEQRLRYEIEVIRKAGFVSYFLITWDFITKAREMGIPVGPGRGSAAGSMVAYCLGITDLDPLRYNLIFERFLNAERVTMPDIDVDFCGVRRDEVIDYVRSKYGDESVAQIITFGTMASRGVLRDVGRVLEMPLADIDRIAKKVPQGPGASLRKALETDPELAEIRSSSPATQSLFDLGLELEGLARHSSIHAAGVVIADRPLIEHVPMVRNGECITTAWQMTELEEIGLLKVDFLGLKTLTILREAVRLVRATRGIDVDLARLDLADRPTYELMSRGDTLGIFQLESSGMRELLGRLAPDSFEDVIAVLALYRPGPLGSGMADMFVRRKHGEEPVDYPHASLQPILEESYGVIIYQEQVMRIANAMAGFTMNQADALRKAMGKKKPAEMAKFKEQFVDGAVANKHPPQLATRLFETMEYFAGYGFNKSHSAAYALLTFQTAWLKAHYPVEFIAANLTVESGNSDKVKEFIDEARRQGFAVLPPDVNASAREFTVEGDAVRFGLGAIKGVGSRAADAIAAERARAGPYRSLDDLCERVDATLLNKTALEAAARCGALESLRLSRKAALAMVDAALRSSARTREDRRRGQGLLFGSAEPPAESRERGDDPAWTEAERLAHEKEVLGFYFSGHPFERRGRFLTRLAGGLDSAALAGLPPKQTVRLAGMVAAVRVAQIRSGPNAGQKMARFRLEDLAGSVAITCFAKTYQKVRSILAEDAIVVVTGRLDSTSDEAALIADEIQTAQQIVDSEVEAIVLRLTQPDLRDDRLERLQRLVAEHRGDHRLLFDVVDGDDTQRISADRRFSVRITDDLIDRLADLVGPGNLGFTRA